MFFFSFLTCEEYNYLTKYIRMSQTTHLINFDNQEYIYSCDFIWKLTPVVSFLKVPLKDFHF